MRERLVDAALCYAWHCALDVEHGLRALTRGAWRASIAIRTVRARRRMCRKALQFGAGYRPLTPAARAFYAELRADILHHGDRM